MWPPCCIKRWLCDVTNVFRPPPPCAARCARPTRLRARNRTPSRGWKRSSCLRPHPPPSLKKPEQRPDEPSFVSESETQVNAGNLTETQRHHLDYWTAFRAYM